MPVNKKNIYHSSRINEQITKELTEILRTVKDPRVSGAFISIIRADTSGDLKFSKVHYSILGSDENEVKKGLVSASGFIRHELAERLNLRTTPELTFIHDNSIEHGANIAKILNDLDS